MLSSSLVLEYRIDLKNTSVEVDGFPWIRSMAPNIRYWSAPNHVVPNVFMAVILDRRDLCFFH